MRTPNAVFCVSRFELNGSHPPGTRQTTCSYTLMSGTHWMVQVAVTFVVMVWRQTSAPVAVTVSGISQDPVGLAEMA